MQAFIRRVQGILTELETAEISGANTAKFQARLNAGARSFHDDNGGCIPIVDPVHPAAVKRTEFFSAFRKSLPKAVPSKQQENVEKGKGSGGNRPLREYTTGWKQAEQDGRLIYDPTTDVFYLTPLHYNNDHPYFRITAPGRRPARQLSCRAASSPWRISSSCSFRHGRSRRTISRS